MKLLRDHWPLFLVLAAFIVLGALYSIVNPLFESPDEVWHYEYVRWLVEGRGLPKPDEVGTAPWAQEGSQPPLYYLVTALLTAPISTDNAADVIRYNPHVAMGDALAFGNKNVILHGHLDAWPWQGVVLAAHVARFFSLLLGAVTVVSAYGTALAILPRRRSIAVMAAALVAFNPQFLFLSAAVNNDNAVIAASSATVWLIASVLAKQMGGDASGPDRSASPRAWQLVLLGALAGIAALSKLSGLAVIGLVALGLAALAWRRHSFAALVRWGAVAGAVALLVAGWWYARNWMLYGSPLGLDAMFEILPRRAVPPTVAELVARSQGVWRSVWAVFGWFNVTVDEWLYRVYDLLAVAGLAGLMVVLPARGVLTRHSHASQEGLGCGTSSRLQVALLAIWVSVVFIALLSWAQMRYPQGRLLFPALSSVAVLLSIGLSAWVPRRLGPALALVLAGGMLALALLVPFRWIAPAYAAPSTLVGQSLVPNQQSVIFGDGIELVGYEVESAELRPGDTLRLTLYWRASRPIRADYSVFVHLVDELGIVQAQRDSYPGAGASPTSEWSGDVIIQDPYVISIPTTSIGPADLRIDVGLYSFDSGTRLPVAGGGESASIGFVELLPRVGEAGQPNPVSINFGDQIELIGFDVDRRAVHPGETVTLRLWWEALAVPATDYVVFTHLVLAPDAVWAGSDQMPLSGQSRTSTWSIGQRVEDSYALALPADAPPGIYFVEIGLYDPTTVDRLMVNFSDKGIVLAQIKVE